MATTRITLVLDSDAADLLLKLAGGSRQRGRLVSRLVRKEAQDNNPDVAQATMRAVLAKVKQGIAELEAALDK